MCACPEHFQTNSEEIPKGNDPFFTLQFSMSDIEWLTYRISSVLFPNSVTGTGTCSFHMGLGLGLHISSFMRSNCCWLRDEAEETTHLRYMPRWAHYQMDMQWSSWLISEITTKTQRKKILSEARIVRALISKSEHVLACASLTGLIAVCTTRREESLKNIKSLIRALQQGMQSP